MTMIQIILINNKPTLKQGEFQNEVEYGVCFMKSIGKKSFILQEDDKDQISPECIFGIIEETPTLLRGVYRFQNVNKLSIKIE